MLLAVVLHLTPLDAAAQRTSARQALRWFKGWLEAQDAALFAGLQSAHHARAYTLSGVTLLDGGKCFCLRITSLNPDLSALLTARLPDLVGGEIVLDPRHGQARFAIASADFGLKPRAPFAPPRVNVDDPSAWAGATTHGQLITTIMQPLEHPALGLRLHFHTCTSFRRNAPNGFKSNLSLPVPRYVFQSYLRQWEALSPANLPVQIAPFLEHYVWVRYHSIRTSRALFAGGQRGKVVGFSGRVEFGLPRQSDLPREMRRDWRHYLDVMRLLAAFSFYCGTGISTSSGLGQTLPLHPEFVPEDR